MTCPGVPRDGIRSPAGRGAPRIGVSLMIVAMLVAPPAATTAQPANETPRTNAATTDPRPAESVDSPATPDGAPRRAVARAVVYTALLLTILLFAVWALRRFSLRYRGNLVRPRRRPTASDDVWSMHKTPEPADDDQEDSA
ncbi:MAG: hypothetical protein V3T70_08455 [Phycisphaerae bacterium]